MPVDKNCGVQIERLRVCASKVNDAVGQFAGKRGAPAPIQVGVKMGPYLPPLEPFSETLLGKNA